jgi:integrase/recombinase XerD
VSQEGNVQALRVMLTETLGYWTVVGEDWRPVEPADSYLRHLRLGADRAEGTARAYAGDLACFFAWCQDSGRDVVAGARDLSMFVAMLRTTPVTRAGSGHGRVRSPGRINHLLAAVRECYKHAVANGAVEPSVLAFLYEVGDDRHLPAELRPEGSGLRYRARPRRVQRARRGTRPVPVRREEVEALLGACRTWRDRFLLVLLWFCGLRVGEALGLRRSDLHLASSSAALGCTMRGPHLHVVGRDNANGARAKTGERSVPVPAEVLACYDRYLRERDACPGTQDCDFVLVNTAHAPLGHPMTTDALRKWLAASSRRAGLSRAVTPHMFRHATATELLARGAGLDVVKELLGHSSIRSTERYLHPSLDAQREAVERLGPLEFGTEAR